MPSYEYKVVPAPRRGVKAKGARTVEERFAQALQATMNTLGAEGWEYQRSDTLPADERSGLTGRTTVFHNMLVFRRALPAQPVTAPDDAAQLAPPAIELTPPSPPPLIAQFRAAETDDDESDTASDDEDDDARNNDRYVAQ
ncbi:DUF4177 domain-containing protein [Limimaricola sp.]|uniref:DUF4177 domain-containing protein n=1 Tax=Limimaricola sp. TaxID=2211665 RepID=UPI0025C67EB4|nr:DUF4177 domain-containing protein [Limimaricola sp.]